MPDYGPGPGPVSRHSSGASSISGVAPLKSRSRPRSPAGLYYWFSPLSLTERGPGFKPRVGLGFDPGDMAAVPGHDD
jgi:hypothetical protein